METQRASVHGVIARAAFWLTEGLGRVSGDRVRIIVHGVASAAGVSGRSMMAALGLGSVGDYVVHGAACPVAIVPPPSAAAVAGAAAVQVPQRQRAQTCCGKLHRCCSLGCWGLATAETFRDPCSVRMLPRLAVACPTTIGRHHCPRPTPSCAGSCKRLSETVQKALQKRFPDTWTPDILRRRARGTSAWRPTSRPRRSRRCSGRSRI